jgi:hypothetical protein
MSESATTGKVNVVTESTRSGTELLRPSAMSESKRFASRPQQPKGCFSIGGYFGVNPVEVPPLPEKT